MLLNYADKQYIDIDSITALRWIERNELGVVVLDGAKMGLTKEEFDIIERAYLWKNKHTMYGKDMKKIEKKGE